MKLLELKNMLKENGLKGYSHLNKPELIKLFTEKNIIPLKSTKDDLNCFLEKLAEISKQCKHIMLQNEIEKLIQKYKSHSLRKNHHPGNIRKEPKSVKITNIETGIMAKLTRINMFSKYFVNIKNPILLTDGFFYVVY